MATSVPRRGCLDDLGAGWYVCRHKNKNLTVGQHIWRALDCNKCHKDELLLLVSLGMKCDILGRGSQTCGGGSNVMCILPQMVLSDSQTAF